MINLSFYIQTNAFSKRFKNHCRKFRNAMIKGLIIAISLCSCFVSKTTVDISGIDRRSSLPSDFCGN